MKIHQRKTAMSDLTQQGITALNAGDQQQARQLFRLALEENPQDVQAWLWLSGAVETDQERLECLQAIIKLDPEHTLASKGIARLIANGSIELQVKPAEDAPPPPAPVQSQPILTPAEQPAAPVGRAPRILFETRPSFVPFVIGSVLMLIVLGLGGGLISALISDDNLAQILIWGFLCLISLWAFAQVFSALIRALAARYTLTTRHLIVQSGVFSRSKKTIPIAKIQDVSTYQHFLFRPFGIGDLIVESAGEYGQTKLRALPHFQQRSDQILKLIHKHN
jgi:membrane protein YdbS with pleckstrin-like domain